MTALQIIINGVGIGTNIVHSSGEKGLYHFSHSQSTWKALNNSFFTVFVHLDEFLLFLGVTAETNLPYL